MNNKGFDILEKNSTGEIVRYIEVKTLTGEWRKGGVAVTSSQLKFALDHDNWWLFVIENINTQNTTVHIFENPVQQGKQLTDTDKRNRSVVPKEGDRYSLSNEIYEVIRVESKGKFYKVRLKEINTGQEVTKKFDPSWEKY